MTFTDVPVHRSRDCSSRKAAYSTRAMAFVARRVAQLAGVVPRLCAECGQWHLEVRK